MRRRRPQVPRRQAAFHRGAVEAGAGVGRAMSLRLSAGDARPTLKGDTMTRLLHTILERVRLGAESGMTTAEYAVGTLAACAFAAVLLAVVKSPAVRDALARAIVSAIGG